MRLLGLCALLLAVLPAPAVAAAASGGACTLSAHVRWEVDLDRSTVDRAIVEVPGCPDGEMVGLQLLTADGDVPDEPMVEAVADERAVFDLAPHAPGIGPTVGVRVMLRPSSGVGGQDRMAMTVDRRFFNHAGKEQRGLREVERLSLRVGDTYVVAGPPDGYRATDCAEVGLATPGDVVAQGVGTFRASAPGRHLACYRHAPGSSGGHSDEGGVMGDAVASPGIGGPAQPSARFTPPAGGLASTGASVAALVGLALLLLGLGRRLTSTRR